MKDVHSGHMSHDGAPLIVKLKSQTRRDFHSGRTEADYLADCLLSCLPCIPPHEIDNPEML